LRSWLPATVHSLSIILNDKEEPGEALLEHFAIPLINKGETRLPQRQQGGGSGGSTVRSAFVATVAL